MKNSKIIEKIKTETPHICGIHLKELNTVFTSN